MIVRPAKNLTGVVRLPGDKSVSHRVAMLGGIASGTTLVENFATSADCASTVECMRQLGVGIDRDGQRLSIRGAGIYGLKAPVAPLDCGNSGTTMRLLAGILAGQDFGSTLTGDESLRQRPMRRIADPLNAMGGSVATTDGKPPVVISGRSLKGTEYELPVASAQIKSCVLLAGLNAAGQTSVIEPVRTRDHTERMLRWFGVDVLRNSSESGQILTVTGGVGLRSPGDYVVPGDLSAATFFLAAGNLPGSSLTMENVGLNPTRSAIIDVVRGLGVRVEVVDERELNEEPVGTIVVTGGLNEQRLEEVRGDVVANVIDELPALAILGTQVSSGLTVRDATELRVKETDRISAIVKNLQRMDADVEEFEDGFRVRPSRLKGAVIDSFGDHRIAMAFAIAGLMADGETEIVGAECASVSFPDFFEQLENVAVYE